MLRTKRKINDCRGVAASGWQKESSRRQLFVIGGLMSPGAGSRPRVPLRFELLYCLSLLSVLLYSFDAGHLGLPAVVTLL